MQRKPQLQNPGAWADLEGAHEALLVQPLLQVEQHRLHLRRALPDALLHRVRRGDHPCDGDASAVNARWPMQAGGAGTTRAAHRVTPCRMLVRPLLAWPTTKSLAFLQ